MLGASRSQMLSRLNNDMNVVESLYRSSLLAPLIFGIAGVGAFVSIWWVRPSIAVYLFALGASSFALQYAMSRRKKRVSTRIQALMASLLTAASECLTDRPVIRLMNAYRGVLGHTERLRKTYLAAGREDAAIQSGADMVVGGASLLQYVGVMLISIFYLSKGQMEAAQIMVVLQLSGLVVSGFTLVGNALIALRGYLPALDRVEEILTLDEEDLETGASAWKDLEKEGIRASDAVLCFSPEKKLALKDPLDIPAGRISALCGASGCRQNVVHQNADRLLSLRGRYLHRRHAAECLFQKVPSGTDRLSVPAEHPDRGFDKGESAYWRSCRRDGRRDERSSSHLHLRRMAGRHAGWAGYDAG